MTLGRAGGKRGHGGVDAVAAHQQRGDRLDRGVRSLTCRERERMVMITSSSEGAHRIQTVRAAGSSTP